MKSKTSSDLLVEYFREVAKCEFNYNLLKKDLIENKRFDAASAFAYLDADKKGFLTLFDFRNLLQGEDYGDEELRKLIHFYDLNGDFAIDFNEFTSIFSGSESREGDPKELETRMINLIKSVFLEDINILKVSEQSSEKLKKDVDFSSQEAFEKLVNDTKFPLTNEILEKFLKANAVTTEFLARIFTRLDADKDGVVNFDEFQDTFGSRFLKKAKQVSNTTKVTLKPIENDSENIATSYDIQEKPFSKITPGYDFPRQIPFESQNDYGSSNQMNNDMHSDPKEEAYLNQMYNDNERTNSGLKNNENSGGAILNYNYGYTHHNYSNSNENVKYEGYEYRESQDSPQEDHIINSYDYKESHPNQNFQEYAQTSINNQDWNNAQYIEDEVDPRPKKVGNDVLERTLNIINFNNVSRPPQLSQSPSVTPKQVFVQTLPDEEPKYHRPYSTHFEYGTKRSKVSSPERIQPIVEPKSLKVPESVPDYKKRSKHSTSNNFNSNSELFQYSNPISLPVMKYPNYNKLRNDNSVKSFNSPGNSNLNTSRMTEERFIKPVSQALTSSNNNKTKERIGSPSYTNHRVPTNFEQKHTFYSNRTQDTRTDVTQESIQGYQQRSSPYSFFETSNQNAQSNSYSNNYICNTASRRIQSPSRFQKSPTHVKLSRSPNIAPYSNNQNRLKDDQRLASFLFEISAKEQELEALRITLDSKLNITIEELYYLFDTDKKGSLAINEFSDGLKRLGIIVLSNLSYIFRRFDKDCDGYLK